MVDSQITQSLNTKSNSTKNISQGRYFKEHVTKELESVEVTGANLKQGMKGYLHIIKVEKEKANGMRKEGGY